MLKIGLAIAALLAAGALLGTAMAQTQTVAAQKVSPQPAKEPAQPGNKDVLREEDVKELLLLMDTDKNGKISKAEWMKFMPEEFDRLDKDKSGELDPEELKQSRFLFRHDFLRVGK
jgi:EF hand